MNFLAGLGRAVAIVVIVGFCVILGAFGSCWITNTGWKPEAGTVLVIGALVGLILGVVAVTLLFRRP